MLDASRRFTLGVVIIAIIATVALVAILPRLPGGEPPSRPQPSATGVGEPTSGTTPGIGTPVAPGTAGASGGTASLTPELRAVLVGAGDIAVCGSDGDSQTAALLDGIGGTVFTVGDNAYEKGTPEEFANCYGPTWGRHLDRTRPSPGNHEYGTAGAAGYFGYFGARAGDPDEGYYAYDLGAWRVYSLNTNCRFVGCGEDSAQLAWLEADLLANPKPCTVAYWHAPRYSSGRHGNDDSANALWDALYEAGAELVLAGHDHSYERFAPMNADGNLAPDRGIVSFVVGTGGRALYEFHDVLTTSRARNATTWGVLELTLAPGAWSSRFVPVAGGSFTDTATGTCH